MLVHILNRLVIPFWTFLVRLAQCESGTHFQPLVNHFPEPLQKVTTVWRKAKLKIWAWQYFADCMRENWVKIIFFFFLITYSMGAASKIINRFRDLCVKTGNEK